MNQPSLSLFQRVVMGAVLPAALIISTFVGYLVWRQYWITSEHREHEVAVLADEQAFSLGLLLQQAASPVDRTAQLAVLRPDLPTQDYWDWFRGLLDDNAALYGTGVTFWPANYGGQRKDLYVLRGTQGNFIKDGYAYQDESFTYDGADGTHEWFTLPQTLGRPMWSEPYYDDGSGFAWMVTYSRPYYRKRDQAFDGVAFSDLRLDTLGQQIHAAASFGEKALYALVTPNGAIVTHSDPSLSGKPVKDWGAGTDLLTLLSTAVIQHEGLRKISGWPGQGPVWLTRRSVPGVPWVLVTAVPDQTWLWGLGAAEIFAIGLLIAGVTGVLLFGLRITRQVTTPIVQMRDAAEQVARGNWNIDIPFTSRDELGQLAGAFRQMADEVSAREAQLKRKQQELELLNDELEARVTQRTADAESAERRMRDVTDHLPAVVFQMHKAQRHSDDPVTFTYVSPASEEVWGLSQHQVANVPEAWAIIPPDDIVMLQRMTEESAQTMMPYHCEYRITHPRDGQLHWIAAGMRPRGLSDGGVMWSGYAVDVTRQKILEAELDTARRELDNIVNTVPGVLWQIAGSAAGPYRYSFISGGLRDLVGIEAKDAMRDFMALLALVHPEDLPLIGTNLAETGRSQGSAMIEFRSRHALSGASIWLRAECRAQNQADGTTLWSGYWIDITRQKSLEVELAAARRQVDQIANSIPGVVYQVKRDAEGKFSFAYISDGVLALRGITKQKASEDFDAIIATVLPEDKPLLLSRIADSAAELLPMSREYRVRHALTGDILWIRAASVPFRHDDGSTRWNGYWIDVTEQKKLEQQLERAREEADKANVAKGRFLAIMSHELRTPMNAIIGLSHLALQAGQVPSQTQDWLDKIHRSAKHLLAHINDVLDFSKIEAGKLEIERVNFSLAGVLEDSRGLLAFRAEEKGLTLKLMVGAEVPDGLTGDPLRLQQILLNLAGNAIKFTERGGVEIAVTHESGRADWTRLRFEVRDTGVGIASEAQARLFKPFSQADASTTRRFGGTGLGLAICKQIVELMEGSIGVDSAEGEGSVFWFTAEFGRALIESGNLPAAQPVFSAGAGLDAAALAALEPLSARLSALDKLLARDDAEALDAWNALLAEQPLLQQAPPARRVRAALSTYNYPAARAALAELLSLLRPVGS